MLGAPVYARYYRAKLCAERAITISASQFPAFLDFGKRNAADAAAFVACMCDKPFEAGAKHEVTRRRFKHAQRRLQFCGVTLVRAVLAHINVFFLRIHHLRDTDGRLRRFAHLANHDITSRII
jgi:hypothetical protein